MEEFILLCKDLIIEYYHSLDLDVFYKISNENINLISYVDGVFGESAFFEVTGFDDVDESITVKPTLFSVIREDDLYDFKAYNEMYRDVVKLL